MTSSRPTLVLLSEALAMLIGASVVVRLGGGRVFRGDTRPLTNPRPIAQGEAATLVRAILAVSRRLPWRSLCFEQGLAAHWMLSRRRIRSTIFYGAAMPEGELKAHVWVRSGDTDIIGCDNASDFAILSRFSNDSSSSPVQP